MKIKQILLVFWLAAAMVTFTGTSMAVSAPKNSTLAYHDTWRALWEDHIQWTRSVIFLILDGTNSDINTIVADPYVQRLLKNNEDMKDALRPYYAAEDVEELGALISEHLTIAAQLLVAAKFDPASFDVLNLAWYDNAKAIAAKMEEMNPNNWPASVGEPMWTMHLDATIAEAVAHLTGDHAAEVAAFDMVHSMALEMADFFSAGIIKQSNSQFTGSR